ALAPCRGPRPGGGARASMAWSSQGSPARGRGRPARGCDEERAPRPPRGRAADEEVVAGAP
ncbi:unnamed protein product, partial [Prorocentrum cordatum]